MTCRCRGRSLGKSEVWKLPHLWMTVGSKALDRRREDAQKTIKERGEEQKHATETEFYEQAMILSVLNHIELTHVPSNIVTRCVHSQVACGKQK